MTKPTFKYSPSVLRAMQSDPKLAAVLREFEENAQKASALVETGEFVRLDDAMEAVTGNRPQPIDVDDLDDEDRKKILEATKEECVDRPPGLGETKN